MVSDDDTQQPVEKGDWLRAIIRYCRDICVAARCLSPFSTRFQASRDPPSRGLRRFVVKLLCFAALQVAVLAAVDFRLARLPNSYSIKVRRLAAAADPPVEVLLLGSSHELYGLNPDELNLSAVNLAGYSQDLYYDAQLVRCYLDRLPALKCVVMGLSYFTLEYDMEQSTEAWRSCYYRRYFGIPHRHAWLEFQPGNYSLVFQYGPKLARSLLLDEHPPDVTGNVRANGWAEFSVPEDPAAAVRDGEQRVTAHHTLMHAENGARNLAILDELFDELRQRNIQVVLVTTPVYETYSANFDPVRQERWQAAVRHLQSRHGVLHFDFTNDPRFGLRDFSNSDHLNRDGAAKLSRLFGQELQVACRLSGTLLARTNGSGQSKQ